MKRLLIGGIAVLAIGLGIPAPAGATPNDCADPNGACHEFDWAQPYYAAFQHQRIQYLADAEGIPIMEATDRFCHMTMSKIDIQGSFNLTEHETIKVLTAAREVCPS